MWTTLCSYQGFRAAGFIVDLTFVFIFLCISDIFNCLNADSALTLLLHCFEFCTILILNKLYTILTISVLKCSAQSRMMFKDFYTFYQH